MMIDHLLINRHRHFFDSSDLSSDFECGIYRERHVHRYDEGNAPMQENQVRKDGALGLLHGRSVRYV